MGREIKRVALDFGWPLEKVWPGYINLHYKPCPQCNAGFPAAYDVLRAYISPLMWDKKALHEHPEVRQVTTYLAGRGPGCFGSHDGCDIFSAVTKLGELAGLPERWYTCPHCGGNGVDPAALEACEAWERIGPPEGEGWQVWETVSEGSPMSPVFSGPGELISWLVGEGYSPGAAYNFVHGGWAPSALMVDGKMYSDIEACAKLGEPKA